MLTNSVAFFTTAFFNTPNGKILPKTDFSAKFAVLGRNQVATPYEWNAAVSNRDTEPYNSIPVSRSMTVSQAALKVSSVAMMVTVFFARVIPV